MITRAKGRSEGDGDAGRSRARPRLAILGAGPTGMEAALAALDAGLDFTVYEQGEAVGGHVRAWGHVRLFTPWSMNVSPRMARHLEAGGKTPPGGDACPTGVELAGELLEPLARLPEVAPRIALGAKVLSVGRDRLLKHEEIGTTGRGDAPFRILLRDRDGRERVTTADVVLDCTGTWGNPNCTGSGGIPAPGEGELGARVVRSIPDVERDARAWAGTRTLLVGAGHSAQTAARSLAALAGDAPGTRVLWAVRRSEPTWGSPPDDPLAERRRLVDVARELAAGASSAIECRSGVVVEALHPVGGDGGGGGAGAGAAAGGREAPAAGGRVAVELREADGSVETLEFDRVLSLTGSVGDHAIYRQLQVHECYATSGPMKLSAALLGSASADCLDQTGHGAETLRNPEPNFFILGEKSYGRNNTFLMRVGWQQVEDVFGLLPPRGDAWR